MKPSTLKEELLQGLNLNFDLQNMVDILRRYKDMGGSQEIAYKTLEELRAEVDNKFKEDLVLELLDFVYGFCSPHMQIWK